MNWIKELLCLISQGLQHHIWLFWCHPRSLEVESGTWILQKPKKVLSILTEAHINHDQIHHARNNWLGPIFLSSGDSHTKGMLFLLHLTLEGITDVDTDPRGRFVSSKVTSSNQKTLFVSLQGMVPEKPWPGGGGRFIKIKMREMKTK